MDPSVLVEIYKMLLVSNPKALSQKTKLSWLVTDNPENDSPFNLITIFMILKPSKIVQNWAWNTKIPLTCNYR